MNVGRQLFFIIGTPRSRTAWLANLFTHGDQSLCFHDGIRTVDSFDELIAKMAQVPGPIYVGDCDNGMVMDVDRLVDRFPNARIAVVQRDPDEVFESLKKLHAGDGLTDEQLEATVEAALSANRYVMDHCPNALFVPFEELASMDSLHALWQHLVPGLPFPANRVAELKNLNVQYHAPEYTATMTEGFVNRVAQHFKD